MEYTGNNTEEERIAALEKKCREMDAQVRSLLDELLDLKSISMKLSRQAGEYRSRDHEQEPDVQVTASSLQDSPAPSSSGAAPSEGSVVVRPKSASQPDVPAAPAEPKMVRIMQSDGTFKMEPRWGDTDTTDSTGGWERKRKNPPNNKNP